MKKNIDRGIEMVVNEINMRSKYGARMDLLSEIERNIYLVYCFEKEMAVGGFSLLFFQPPGAYANQMILSLQALKATKSASSLEKAIALFPKDISKLTNNERQDALEEYDPEDVLFHPLDDIYKDSEENVRELLADYICEHAKKLPKF